MNEQRKPRRPRASLKQSLRREWQLTWRYAYNLPAVVQFRRDAVELTPAAVRMAGDLARDGVAVGHVDELLSADPDLFAAACREVDGLLEDRHDLFAAADRERSAGVGTATSATKSFVVEVLGRHPQFDPSSAIVQVALHQQIRGLIEHHVRMHLRLLDLNVWLNLPSGEEPQLSQRWHRDEPDDRHILKSFVYLRDVTPGSGPLSYVRGSNRAAGRRAVLPSTWDGYGFRVDEADIAAHFGEDAIVSVPGPAGTVVVTDTRGYHRGGWAVDDERLVMMALYASRTSRKRRLIVPAPGVDTAPYRDDVAFAEPV